MKTTTNLLLTSALTLTGCDFFTDLVNDLSGTTLVTEQMTLQPELFGMHSRTLRRYDPGICYPGLLDRTGTTPAAFDDWVSRGGLATNGVMVGYENQELDGQSCVPQVSRIYQGKIRPWTH